MGILKEKKNDWTETLFKGYSFRFGDDGEEEEVAEGFFLFSKPYYFNSVLDFSKNSTFHIDYRNTFRDLNFFDGSTNSICDSKQHNRI